MVPAYVPLTLVGHYVLPNGPQRGECRPALIERIHDVVSGAADLHVFDGEPRRIESVCWSPAKVPGTWHEDGCTTRLTADERAAIHAARS